MRGAAGVGVRGGRGVASPAPLAGGGRGALSPRLLSPPQPQPQPAVAPEQWSQLQSQPSGALIVSAGVGVSAPLSGLFGRLFDAQWAAKTGQPVVLGCDNRATLEEMLDVARYLVAQQLRRTLQSRGLSDEGLSSRTRDVLMRERPLYAKAIAGYVQTQHKHGARGDGLH